MTRWAGQDPAGLPEERGKHEASCLWSAGPPAALQPGPRRRAADFTSCHGHHKPSTAMSGAVARKIHPQGDLRTTGWWVTGWWVHSYPGRRSPHLGRPGRRTEERARSGWLACAERVQDCILELIHDRQAALLKRRLARAAPGGRAYHLQRAAATDPRRRPPWLRFVSNGR